MQSLLNHVWPRYDHYWPVRSLNTHPSIHSSMVTCLDPVRIKQDFSRSILPSLVLCHSPHNAVLWTNHHLTWEEDLAWNRYFRETFLWQLRRGFHINQGWLFPLHLLSCYHPCVLGEPCPGTYKIPQIAERSSSLVLPPLKLCYPKACFVQNKDLRKRASTAIGFHGYFPIQCWNHYLISTYIYTYEKLCINIVIRLISIQCSTSAVPCVVTLARS